MAMTIDTTNMCSHLQKKLFEENGIYHPLWIAMQDDPELTAVVRSRQLHIYRNGKKVLVLAGKATPKVIREDRICNRALPFHPLVHNMGFPSHPQLSLHRKQGGCHGV